MVVVFVLQQLLKRGQGRCKVQEAGSLIVERKCAENIQIIRN